MYFKPDDGHPDMQSTGKFSVGDRVMSKHRRSSTALGHIVRIYQPSYDDTPYITVKWFCNGAIGYHDVDNLELVAQ